MANKKVQRMAAPSTPFSTLGRSSRRGMQEICGNSSTRASTTLIFLTASKSTYYVDGDLPSMAIFRFFLGEPSPDNVSLHHRAHAEFELRQSCRQDAPLQAAALHAVLATLHALDTLAAPNSSTGPRI